MAESIPDPDEPEVNDLESSEPEITQQENSEPEVGEIVKNEPENIINQEKSEPVLSIELPENISLTKFNTLTVKIEDLPDVSEKTLIVCTDGKTNSIILTMLYLILKKKKPINEVEKLMKFIKPTHVLGKSHTALYS